MTIAPNGPGIPARGTSSAKSGIGTAFSAASRVWFTTSHGILNEIYYPRIDAACTRDIGFIVTGPHGYFSEEKRHATHTIAAIEPGVPAFRLINDAIDGQYRIEKSICTDPIRDVLLQHTRFIPAAEGLRLFLLAAPHLSNHGDDNTGRIDAYKGRPLLVAERADRAMAITIDAPWAQRSVGYVGTSDGWTDLRDHGDLSATYDFAPDGNVALCGEIDLAACDGEFTLAIGFGHTTPEAAHGCVAALNSGYATAERAYAEEWRQWFSGLDLTSPDDDVQVASAQVLHCHEAVSFPGGVIASLSIPWGFAKGDSDLGGYHLVWPRDLVEAAGGMLACGAHTDVKRVIDYLQATQNEDGSWPQNMWLDGTPYWNGIQLDETALPILLVDLWRRTVPDSDATRYWPMILRAAGFVVRSGPVTAQDRWEEDAGYAPFSIAASIAALLAAADLADDCGDQPSGVFWRETADWWNENIERWMYVAGTDLADEVGVDGYYVRIGASDPIGAASPTEGWVAIKNRPLSESMVNASEIVSPDALALVRFGLRSPDDQRILDTVRVIDHTLRVELPQGPAWRRYTGDGYGEHPNGDPYDGTGVGRPWPLLTGERGHFELARGAPRAAAGLADTMAGFAVGGLLPEQVWDGPTSTDHELAPGGPTGSAMPLVWAHAEYLKLRRSLATGNVFDLPPQTVGRYIDSSVDQPPAVWRPDMQVRSIEPNRPLRIVVHDHVDVVWSVDAWRTKQTTTATDTGQGVWYADIEPALPGVEFTMRWPDRWEGTNYWVSVNEEAVQ